MCTTRSSVVSKHCIKLLFQNTIPKYCFKTLSNYCFKTLQQNTVSKHHIKLLFQNTISNYCFKTSYQITVSKHYITLLFQNTISNDNRFKTLSYYSKPHTFRSAHYGNTYPRGPALFGISWDGGNASKRRSYTPILISVANTDSASPDTCVCVGYLPKLPPGVTKKKDSDVRRELVQKCIGAIIKVINASAAAGFTCTVHNSK